MLESSIEIIMNKGTRVRYAPSPTGEPHVGNIRTAFFNWLYARHTGGSFIVRVEDTDQSRIVDGALEAIFSSLKWLGLDWDEGPDIGGNYAPYIQSQRLVTYKEAAEHLIEEGYAYYCYCTPEQLTQMRQEQQRHGQSIQYSRHCRDLPVATLQSRDDEQSRIIRFKTPLTSELIKVSDIIRGEVTFNSSLLDDFVLLKSDGYPTYHLASVVDDHAMDITHVLRAEEWLPSTPRHLLLYKALGYQIPRFGHLPMILGPDRAKLSKRHGATSLLEYRDSGYLPGAMCNFLALLGWSFDDKTEIIPINQLIQEFSLNRVGKSPAIFDLGKLTWMNGVYIRQLKEEDMARHLHRILDSYIRSNELPVEVEPTLDYLRHVVPLVQERLKTINPEEVWGLCSFFLVSPWVYKTNTPIPKGMDKSSTLKAVQETELVFRRNQRFDPEGIEQALRNLGEQMQIRSRELFGAIRVAITGRTAAPPLFETLAVLGKDRVLARLQETVDILITGS